MGDSSDKEPTLTEEHVIIIACVCAVIIITLLIILVCFCLRRKRYLAKGSSPGVIQGDPPPYQAVPANKKPSPQGFDNQDNHPNRQHQEGGGGYSSRDLSPMVATHPHNPHPKDKYLDLQDRGDMVDHHGGHPGAYPPPPPHLQQQQQHPGSEMMTVGGPGSGGGGGKPKKVIYEVVV